MNFNFDSNATTIKKLFKKYSQFKVPVFQRDYSWDKLYYKQFLADIIDSLDKHTESPEVSVEDKNYFIGTMVLSGPENATTIDVVDGQQRLTVITILFSAISKRFKEINEQKLSNATFRYVQEEDDNGELTHHLVSDSSSPFIETFIQSLDHQHAAKPNTLEEESLKETYDDFFEALDITNLQKNSFFSEMCYRDMLLAIRGQILSASIIEITTTNKKSAYKIFEILNAKGKSLASIDLIKNSIFEVYYNNDAGLESLANATWKNIQTNLRLRNSNVGLATFYRQYWISKYEKVTNQKLYDSFNKIFIQKYSKEDRTDKYIEFLKDMERESLQYIKIISPRLEDYNNRQEYKPVVQSLESLNNVFAIKQYIVVVLALMYLKGKNLISLKTLKESLRFLESFVFMYTSIGKGQANIYEPRFSRLAIKLRKSKNKRDTNEIINTYLYENLKEKKIEYSAFKDRFTKLTFSKRSNTDNKLCRYVVGKICSSYEGSETFPVDNSVEHIICEKTKDDRVKNIGNLIDLETSLNNDAQDFSYLNKKEIYHKSKNKQITKFVNSNDDFTISDIAVRADKLSLYYYDNIIKKDLKY